MTGQTKLQTIQERQWAEVLALSKRHLAERESLRNHQEAEWETLDRRHDEEREAARKQGILK